MRVVSQGLAVALLLDAQQHLHVLAVLIAAGLLVALHPRLDLVFPQSRVLRRLLLRGGALCHEKQGGVIRGSARRNLSCGVACVFFTFTLEDFLEPSRKACGEQLKYEQKGKRAISDIKLPSKVPFAFMRVDFAEFTFLARAEDAGGSLSPLFLRFLSTGLLPRRPVVRVMVVGVCWKVE